MTQLRSVLLPPLAVLCLGLHVGCAATPEALLAAQRREIARAEAAGAAGFPDSHFYLKSAQTEMREAERLFRLGMREDGEARLGNARADARLARTVAEGEQAAQQGTDVERSSSPSSDGASRTSIPTASLFDGHSTDLLPGGEALLNHLVRRLITQQDRTIGLHAYAEDDAGLARAQAARVKDYLVKHGLRAEQLHSESASLAPEDARLEIILHPMAPPAL